MKRLRIFSPLALRCSLTLAGLAWGEMIATAIRDKGDDATGIWVVAVGYPLIYAMWLGMSWLVAQAPWSMDESFMVGPYKKLQLRFQRRLLWWTSNLVIVFLPAAVFIVGLLGLCGLLDATSSSRHAP